MLEEIKKELKFLKILIALLVGMMIIFGGAAFFFNQYINNIYNERIKEEKKEGAKLQRQITDKVNKISDLLKGKDLEKIKAMQSLYNIYFKTRYRTLPKVLILEILEEILPSNSKIGNNIKIGDNASVNLVLYTTDIKGLDVLFNKFKYYSDVLKLLDIKGFDTVTLNQNNRKIKMIVGSNTKYVYRTTIQLQINQENLVKYYSLLYHPTKNYEILKKIYGPDLIEPLKLPKNINISDTIKLHELYEKKYNKKDKSKNEIEESNVYQNK